MFYLISINVSIFTKDARAALGAAVAPARECAQDERWRERSGRALGVAVRASVGGGWRRGAQGKRWRGAAAATHGAPDRDGRPVRRTRARV